MSDHPFEHLQWQASDSYWSGRIQAFGTLVDANIEFDSYDPTDEERQAAWQASVDLYSRLTAQWEQRSREAAAREVTEAVYCQSDHQVTDDDVQKLLSDMSLRSLSFIYVCDEEQAFVSLGYSAQNCFPDQSVNIQFQFDLSIDEVTVQN